MSQLIKVGMEDFKICRAPDVLTTIGLGSCIGIAIRDSATKTGGLAHIMLPDSRLHPESDNKMRFADTGTEELVNALIAQGANRSRLTAKIAGGAQMFTHQTGGDTIAVGEKNARAVREALSRLAIPVIAEDCGGDYGRTVEFYPETGRLIIRGVGRDVKII